MTITTSLARITHVTVTVPHGPRQLSHDPDMRQLSSETIYGDARGLVAWGLTCNISAEEIVLRLGPLHVSHWCWHYLLFVVSRNHVDRTTASTPQRRSVIMELRQVAILKGVS